MIKYFSTKLIDEFGTAYYIIYEQGKFNHPIITLSEQQMKFLFKDIEEQMSKDIIKLIVD